jgi:HD-GYP domain-containing protein (c-di-GMP phosphodiesterase class II)
VQGIEYLVKNGISRDSDIIRYISEHHERCDGSGYPAGSYGDDLSLGGKILAVVDVYDALTSTKIYKQAWSKENAIMYLNKHKEDIFNIDIVDTLIKILEKE